MSVVKKDLGILFSKLLLQHSENQKKNGLLAIIIFGLFISTISILHLIFSTDATNPPCGFFTISLKCDLSGWMKLFIGDIGIGAFLAILLHQLAIRNQKRVDLIIKVDQDMKKKRRVYSLEHLKNLLNLVLFAMGVTKRSINQYNLAIRLEESEKQKWLKSTTLAKLNADEAKIERNIQSIRNLIVASNDILEPALVNRVEGVCNYIGEISVEENGDGSMQFPKYDICRIKIEYLLELLQNYGVSSSAFQNILEGSEQTKIAESVIKESRS
jgi:cell division protein FtsB